MIFFFLLSCYELLLSVRSMPSPIFSLLILLNFIDLQFLVLSLGGIHRHEPFVLDYIPGVRVAFPGGKCINPMHIHDTPPPRAKYYEAWATAGLGLV